MMSWAFDPVQAIALLLFTGSSSSEREVEDCIRVLMNLDSFGAERDHPVAIVILDRDYPAPPATWRKRIAEGTKDTKGRGGLFVLVADSALLRGIITAVNWLREPGYLNRTAASFEEAVAIASKHGHPRPREAFHALLAEARANARNATSP